MSSEPTQQNGLDTEGAILMPPAPSMENHVTGPREDEDKHAPIDASIIHQEPFIDEHYNQTYLYALPKNSTSVYVLWEVGQATRDDLKQRFGQEFFVSNYLVLRVRRLYDGHYFDVEDYMDDKRSYWLELDPDTEYEMELGFRCKGTVYFEKVAHSNKVRTLPAADTTAEWQNEWREIHVDSNIQEFPVPNDQWRWNLYKYWKEGRAERAEEKGCWALVLHMHLPFVRHLEHKVALEEMWLFEAITSCYTQLLNTMWSLERDKIDFRLTVSISPPLISMLSDPQLRDRYRVYLKEVMELAEKELNHHRGGTFQATIESILERLHNARKVFEAYGGDILTGFRDFQKTGKLEIIAVAGTHPILPFYMHYPEMIRGHIQEACKQYYRVFEQWPRGIWLPENAYCPGLDQYLAEAGIKWTLVNSTGLARGSTRCWYDTARPVITHHGVAVFGIDEETRAQVWSREAGYPGDGRYKEWYRDLGYEAGWDYLSDYWKVANVRRNTGIKYYRITGKEVQDKAPYNPEWARQAVNEQSGQFVFYRGTQAGNLRGQHNIKPCVVSAYDAELFGHWWEEGPLWIEDILRKMAFDQAEVRPVTPAEFLAEQSRHQLLTPGMSTWGKKATFETWLDGRAYQPNAWIYRHLFRLTDKLIQLATERKADEGITWRAMNQAVRELMLAQSSDWPFLISMDQSVRYSEVRLIKHISRARELLRQVEERNVNDTFLRTLESADTVLWEDVDFRMFARG